MKKYFYLMFFLSQCLYGVELEALSLIKGKYYFNKKPYSGVAEIKKMDITEKISFENGVKNGLTWYRHAEYGIVYIMNMKNGLRHGKYVSYYSDGSLRDVMTFRAGKMDVFHYHYKKGTNRLSLINPYKNGVLNGTSTKYHDNGLIKLQLEYKNDVASGVCKSYDSTGKIIEDSIYRNGIPISGYKIIDGKKVEIINLTNELNDNVDKGSRFDEE